MNWDYSHIPQPTVFEYCNVLSNIITENIHQFIKNHCAYPLGPNQDLTIYHLFEIINFKESWLAPTDPEIWLMLRNPFQLERSWPS